MFDTLRSSPTQLIAYQLKHISADYFRFSSKSGPDTDNLCREERVHCDHSRNTAWFWQAVLSLCGQGAVSNQAYLQRIVLWKYFAKEQSKSNDTSLVEPCCYLRHYHCPICIGYLLQITPQKQGNGFVDLAHIVLMTGVAALNQQVRLERSCQLG